jgi:hypothetical protein
VSPPARICRLTYLWVHFHSPSPHWFYVTERHDPPSYARRMPLHRCLTGSKGTGFPLPLKDITIATTAADNAIHYHKSISVVPGETMKNAFEQARQLPFEIPGGHLFSPEHMISSTDVDFMDRIWLLGLTLVLIMASGENLLEPSVRLKTAKTKNQAHRPTEYWSPNYLGRVFLAEIEKADPENQQRPHWKKGHLKSQAYDARSSLRKIIWIQPYRTGNSGGGTGTKS